MPRMKLRISRLLLPVLLLSGACAQATVYELAEGGTGLFGREERVVTSYEDTLYEIARRFSLGSEEIVRVNPGMDPWLPGAGREVLIPGERVLPSGPREGIVVNLPEHRLYFYPKTPAGQKPVVITYPVSIDKMDWHTPLGKTRIVSKKERPTWSPPESVRKEHLANGDPLPAIVPAGPDNPLGLYAMRLDIKPGAYLIHGTNNPIAVGMAVTHGCIRMYPEDIEALFPLVPVNTPVYLVNEPLKIAWVNGALMLEAHPPVNAEGQTVEPDVAQFSGMLQQALGDTVVAIHWDLALEELRLARGVPVVVGLAADLPDDETSATSLEPVAARADPGPPGPS